MTGSTDELKISSVPADTPIFYPDTDGKPMAASDRHRRILFRTIEKLEAHYAQQSDVYVSGDILMYYVKGDPHQVISPDVLVSFGLEKKERLTYLVWVEGKVPDFVMEFSSKTTFHDDLGPKKDRYASLGIQDYFLYDALDIYLPTPLMGFTLVDGIYVPISGDEDGGLHSDVLSLDFHVDDVGLGIYDPVADVWLQPLAETRAEQEAARAETAETRAEQEAARAETAETRAEQEAARAETAETRAEQEAARAGQEAARAETAETRAEQEAARAETAETEVAQLREQLERLQSLR